MPVFKREHTLLPTAFSKNPNRLLLVQPVWSVRRIHGKPHGLKKACHFDDATNRKVSSIKTLAEPSEPVTSCHSLTRAAVSVLPKECGLGTRDHTSDFIQDVSDDESEAFSQST